MFLLSFIGMYISLAWTKIHILFPIFQMSLKCMCELENKLNQKNLVLNSLLTTNSHSTKLLSSSIKQVPYIKQVSQTSSLAFLTLKLNDYSGKMTSMHLHMKPWGNRPEVMTETVCPVACVWASISGWSSAWIICSPLWSCDSDLKLTFYIISNFQLLKYNRNALLCQKLEVNSLVCI